jgi:branched-chain amino acid transport system substrate-binding protein
VRIGGFLIPCGLVVAGLLSGCQQQLPKTVRIGVAQPLSGPLAALGTDMRNGAQMAVDELNAQGYKVGGKVITFELVVADDRSDPEEGKRIAQRMIEADVRAVIGNLNSGVSIAAAPIYATRHIPQLSISTNPKFTQLGLATTLRLVANDDQQSRAMGSYAVNQLSSKRIAVLDDGTTYGKGLATLAIEQVKRDGVNVDAGHSVSNETTDFAAFINAVRSQRPEVILAALADFQVAALAEQLADGGMQEVIVIGGDTIKTDKLVAKRHKIKGIYATSPVIDPSGFPRGKQFMMQFQAKFKSDPIYGAHYAYDAVHAIAHSMRRGETATPKGLVAELKRKDLIGPATGGFNFAEDGEQRYPSVAVYRVEGGRWEQMVRADKW